MLKYTSVLRRFDEKHRLEIFSGGHSDLAEMAERQGILYKPCGAGGGDMGVAFSADASSMRAFRDSADAAGFRALDVTPDSRGAAMDDGNYSD
jgi:phosphomevalonate kinase